MERIRLIDPADPRFGDAFALYEISFPVYERRTRAAQAARLSHPEYHFDLLMEGERFLGSCCSGRRMASAMWSTSLPVPSFGGRAWEPGRWPS